MVARRTRSSAAEPQKIASPPPTPAPPAKRGTKRSKPAESPEVKAEDSPTTPPAKTQKRTRGSVKKEPAVEELPHNLGSLPSPDTDEQPPTKKRASRSTKATPVKAEPKELAQLAEKAGIVDEESPKSAKKAKKEKSNKYGLSPGQTPYPDWPHPTPEECHEVVRLLSKVHGTVSAPKEIKPPSLEVAGCGEVPSVLDALIRTRLSAATTNANSSRAFQSLVKTFGTLSEGVGKGSVDWNAVRLASQKEVFEAIKCGGLADSKSKDIKAILQSVYEENQQRSSELKDSKDKDASGPAGAESEPLSEKKDEISRAESSVLSLDHLHLLSNEDAFNKMVKYPGIGPKTASCVLLFCLQRPSFAVDTHVFRLCKYLGWVPPDNEVKKGEPRVERNTTYSHCEVRIPDELKYPLHQLLIKHGKACPRCRAATGMSSERWEGGCPIEHLVKRHGAKKGAGGDGAVTKKKTKTKTTPKKSKAQSRRKMLDDMTEDTEEETEESELSDVGSDFDDEE